MKKFLVMAVAALMAVSAFADNLWSVDWSVHKMYDPDDSTVGIMDNYSIVWDLCWSATSDKASEVILGSRQFTAGSDEYTDYANASYYSDTPLVFDNFMEPDDSGAALIPVGGAATSPGYIWQRIIATSAMNPEMKYIWDGDAYQITAIDSGSLTTPSALDGNGLRIGRTEAWTPYSSPAAIPEPATMSLLGLGALAMVIRRKLRK